MTKFEETHYNISFIEAFSQDQKYQEFFGKNIFKESNQAKIIGFSDSEGSSIDEETSAQEHQEVAKYFQIFVKSPSGDVIEKEEMRTDIKTVQNNQVQEINLHIS